MTSSNDQHAQYPAYFGATTLADSDDVFSFAPPDDVLPENRTYPSYLPSTQLSGMTNLSNGPSSSSSHSRNLTTGPTATSVSFPMTPNTNGPPSPLPPTRNSVAEQRFDSIQSRMGPTPTTGGSGSMLFTFMPPPQDLAPSRPATSSQLSSITEFNSQSSLRPDATDQEDGITAFVRSNSSIGNTSQKLSLSSDADTVSVYPPPAPNHFDPAMDEEEDSPYAEVRASVSNVDDHDMPCFTWRMLAIGLILNVLISGAATYFVLRYPSPSLTYVVPIVCIYFLGKALEFLPIKSWDIGPFVFELNPGPFNIKEHTAALILSAMAGPSLSMGFLIASEKKFNVEPSLCFQVLLLLSCQLSGLSLGGIFRHLVVRPASLIWPGILSTCAMMNIFHAGYDAHSHRGLARPSFFAYATLGAAVYSFIPAYLFTGLSYFSFLCWIWPKNRVVNQLFGTVTGLGMTCLTFDWSQISYQDNPLTTPWWAVANIFAGFVLFYWIILPILYYLNVWKTGHLPIMGYFAYDRFARPYDIDSIIDRSVMRLNTTAYEEYSQLYLPVSFTVTYMLAFIAPALLVTYVALNYGPKIQRWFFNDKDEEPDDIHAKLMQQYPDTPTWWYLVLFAFSFSLLPIALKIEHNMDTPAWVAFLALAIVIIFFLPMTYLYATAGCVVAINVIPEAILGIVLPGRGLPNMMFKTTVMDICILGLACLRWLKLGHYMKIPPRINFCVQILGMFVANLTQLVVKNHLFATVKDICQPGQKSQLTCASVESGYTASVVWGMIGPARLYGRGGLYFPQVFGLLIGALLPIPFWWWTRRRPKSPLRHINLPTFFYSYVGMPPATGINQASFFLAGFIFQYVLRRRRFQWWSKYNYVLSGALDLGTVFGLLLLFFAVQLPTEGKGPLNWWGNTVWQKTADAMGVPFYSTDPVRGFAAAQNAAI